MKILWSTNVVLPDFCNEFNIKRTYAGGWMTGLLTHLKQLRDVEIELCFPVYDEERIKNGELFGTRYYSLWIGKGERSFDDIKEDVKHIIKTSNPDIVHVWGTEFINSHAMCISLRELNFKNMIVDIQGISYYLAERYCKGIPSQWIEYSPGDGIQSILEMKQQITDNSIMEMNCLKNTVYVIGRTRWDEIFASRINPRIQYFHCDRVLRQAFYDTKRFWQLELCRKNTVFVSHGGAPFKGLHFLLHAVKEISVLYPDVEVRVGGYSSYISGNSTGKKSAYGEYLFSIIDDLNLNNNISFLGGLNEQEMIKEYLDANVFLCCSVTENNSNSICEAQYLGTPVISSFVGGLGDIIDDKKTGLFYCYDDVGLLAGLICHAFSHPNEMKRMSKNEREVAAIRHKPSRIVEEMHQIYNSVLKNAVTNNESNSYTLMCDEETDYC